MTDNEIREQVEDGTGYADPGAQTGLSTGEPTDDLHVATGYADHGTQVVLGTREPTDDVHEQAREAAERHRRIGLGRNGPSPHKAGPARRT